MAGLLLGCWLGIGAMPADAQDPPGPEVAELLDGRRLTGRLVAPEGGPIAFEPDPGGEPIPIDRLARVERRPDPEGGRPGAGHPPFILEFGGGQRLSGQLVGIDDEAIRLAVGDDGAEVAVDRLGASTLVQRPGEARVLALGFEEEADAGRWDLGDGAAIRPRSDGQGKAIALDPDGAEARLTLPEPIEAGRVELSFPWGAMPVPGRRWSVDLIFDGPDGEEITRVVLGRADPFPSVESRGGPEIVVQPLTLQPGMHRLSARFGPGRTLLAIDGDELGRGGGPDGPLIALRLLAEAGRDAGPADGLVAEVDDLSAVRLFTPTTSVDVDPGQDEVRLVSGDQYWGAIRSADANGVTLLVIDRPVEVPWSQVAGLWFRREAHQGRAISGPLVLAEWDAGDAEALADRVGGALIGLDVSAFQIATAYAGTITVPRDRLRRLEVLGRGTSLVIDPHARHLGDQPMPELDPPLPDGDRWEVAFTLDEPPDRPTVLVVEAVQVEGEFEGGRFVEDLRKGFLRTRLALDGEPFDDLNRHVTDPNRTPTRLRIPVPAGLLTPGPHTLSFDQLGREAEPEYRDDLGLLRIALEWPEPTEERP